MARKKKKIGGYWVYYKGIELPYPFRSAKSAKDWIIQSYGYGNIKDHKIKYKPTKKKIQFFWR